MPKIKKVIDTSGNVIYPITIAKGVYDTSNNQRLSVTLAGKANTTDLPTVMSGSGSGHKGGLVPDPGATAGTTKYLNEDGTWKVPEEALETVGFGFGTCSTAADTVAKTVSVPNFVLTKNGIVSVIFQNGISVDNSTLNVNGTGAKPLMLNGVALVADVVTENVTVMLQYDDTSWNIIGSSAGAFVIPDQTIVDLGLPSGVKWATKNIDLTQPDGFAASEYQYECSFFSWGNTDGHNPTSTTSFSPYSWGTSVTGSPYSSSTGKSISANLSLSNDAANVNLGGSWRMPTTTEYQELFDNVDYIDADGTVIDPSLIIDKRVTVNGIVGIYLRSKLNDKTIFFPCSGGGSSTSWSDRGEIGWYWSSIYYSSTMAKCLSFDPEEGTTIGGNYFRYGGLPIRPVQ